MPRLPPGQAPARHRHDQSAPRLGVGWCLPCYENGAFTLALDPDRSECALHSGPSGQQSAAEPTSVWPPRPSRSPRGRAARPSLSRPPAPRRPLRRALHRRVARALADGRRRAAARLTTGTYQPHPGWRHFIDTGWRVLTDQTEALRIVTDLIDAQDWRADKRTSWLAILRCLVYSMDWSTGLVTALTAHRLGQAGDRAPRTVSRVLAWARDQGLIVVVEHAASAEFLGTPHGRTPTYALVTNTPPRSPTRGGTSPNPHPSPASAHPNAQLILPVEENGDLPTSCVSTQPLNGNQLNPPHQHPTPWLAFRIPESPSERNLATQCLLQRLGLDRGGVSRVPLWRARALLRPWWQAGASPAGLLYAIDHHPNHPTHHRGDALRGAHDPLRVLGHRLQPWRGRLTELPPTVRGIHGDYQHPPTPTTPPPHPPTSAHHPTSRTEVRHAAQAALREHLRLLRERRENPNEGRPPAVAPQ